MKLYFIYCRGKLLYTFNQQEYDNWVKEQAKKHCGIYRIIGDNKNDYGIDFDRMYRVKVLDLDDELDWDLQQNQH